MSKDQYPYHIPLLLVICSLAFFSHLASYSPPTIMEARNFISAREMLETGDWMIPTLNGNIRIRKPPLPTWITAASIAVAGDPNSLTALRFPAALIATLMILFLYGFVKDITKNQETAFYSAAVLATSFMFIEEARSGAWDIYSNAFMLGGVWMFYKSSQTGQLKYWSLAGLLMALSFLSKGPVSFYAMLLPFLIAFFLGKNRFSSPIGRGLAVFFTIFLVASAFWPVYLYFKIPDLAAKMVEEESSAWVNRHNRPVWFYLHFPLFTGIWTFVLLSALIGLRKAGAGFEPSKVRLIITWFLAAFVLLSVIPEKKERYFLPALPPLAMLCGMFISHHLDQLSKRSMKKLDEVVLKIQGILMLSAMLVIPAFLWLYGYKTGDMRLPTFIFLSFLALLLFFIIGWPISKGRISHVYAATITVMLFICLTSWPFLPNMMGDNPLYTDLRGVRTITTIAEQPLYSTVELNPVRLWEIGSKVSFVEEGEMPPTAAVVISSEPIPGAKKHYKFYPNPDDEWEVLYFNISR
ncbi:putative glycosyltransferase [Fulvivirga imtechensis AK7]|uniref:Putative glycosyltransferase n=1 Tax=Fulvivirga imtechensis AK7 TaxID=1237149 RepID=L8K0M3_9BACT|nr:glycosyltransferase family 39 protein [Fulvivirga imtechensis]ELR73027.1 putative glycosyltransferase [Fulvivirga imtechensis AK7]